MQGFSYLIFILTGLAVGFIAAWLLARGREEAGYARANGEAAVERTSLQERLDGKVAEAVRLESGFAQAREQLAEAVERGQRLEREKAVAEEKAARVLVLEQALAEARQHVDGLKDKLKGEASLRATAEERNSRIPALEAVIQSKDEEIHRLHQAVAMQQAELAEQRARMEEQQIKAEEHLSLLKEAKDKLSIEFQNLANKILEEKSAKFTEQNRDNIDNVLKPMREQLSEFKKKIEDVYDKESKDRVSLFNEITNLKAINQRISEDAINLTNALKGQSKTQGNWGELVLERVLEVSGLRKGHEYAVQGSFKDSEGRLLRPDVIVHLPEGKDVIIDSKVSLTDYERHVSTDDEIERSSALAGHLGSIRAHIKGLSAKNYDSLPGLRSLDLVIMFIPIEAAYLAAFGQDQGLLNEAFEKGVMIVCPSTLLTTLRIIHNLWRYEYQNLNAQDIAEKAGALHDQFVAFIDALEDVGEKLGKAQTAYHTAHKRLTSGNGNLVRRAKALETLGAKTKKKLPETLVAQAVDGEDQPMLESAS